MSYPGQSVVKNIKFRLSDRTHKLQSFLRRQYSKISSNVSFDAMLYPHVIAALSTVVTIIISTYIYIKSDPPNLGASGTFIASVGQIIVLFWMVAAFYHQRYDFQDQREELKLQSRAMQLQNAFEIMRFHISRLDHICRSILLVAIGPEKFSEVDRRATASQKVDAYLSILSDSPEIQEMLHARLINLDQSMAALVERYVKRSDLVAESLKALDWQMEIRDVTWTDTPANELNVMIRTHCKTNNEDDFSANYGGH